MTFRAPLAHPPVCCDELCFMSESIAQAPLPSLSWMSERQRTIIGVGEGQARSGARFGSRP